MEVKIKKSVLFNLLKSRLSENRTYGDNPGGNFIHPFDINDGPVIPDAQMATQLSVSAPPVEDPEYVPATMRELRAAAERISQEVPSSQIEDFYRLLHKSLDITLDNAESAMVNEVYSGEGIINILKEYIDDDDPLVRGPIEAAAKKYVESDGMLDVYEVADELEQRFENLGYSISSTEIADKIMDAASEIGSSDTGDTGLLATTPSTGYRSPSSSAPEVQTQADDDDSGEDVSDEDAERLMRGVDQDLEREEEVDSRPKVLRAEYWNKLTSEVESGKIEGLFAVAQSVIDSMDAVSRIIGTETAAKFGYAGAGTEESQSTQGEASSWKGILSNEVNTNDEVTYKLPAKKKTEQFWKPRVIKFINKFGTGSAGTLSQVSEDFSRLVNVAYDKYQEGSGLDITRFLDQVSNRVVESILYHPTYGALTRNAPAGESELLSKLIDTGFSSQTKKEPFNIPNKTVFRSRNLDPSEMVKHADEEKTLMQAIVDAVVAYTIVKSDEFKSESRQLDAELEKEERDAAIQSIISDLSNSDTFSYTSGRGKAKSTISVMKNEIVSEVEAYVAAKFAEAQEYAESRDRGEEMSDEEIASYMDDESLSEEEKRARFTDEVGSEIMRNTGSVASYRNYVTSVLNKKFDGAVKGLKDLDDPDTQDDANYVTVFNDTLGEVLPGIEKALISITRDLRAAGQEENLRFMANAIAEVRAIRELLYSDKTRGGEQFIQNLEGNIFAIGDEEVDALEFFSDGLNSGPAILRYVVSEMMGATLKGNSKSIEGIDFSFEKKIKATSEDATKEAMQRFADMLKPLDRAQEAAYRTAQEIGVKESKAKFTDSKAPGVQVKTIYPFFGRVKKLPDFDKLNAAAKNYVCWFSYLAEQINASPEERVLVAKRQYNEMQKFVDQITGRAVSQAKKDEEGVVTDINKILSEIEAVEDFTQSKVKELNRDDEKMKTIVKKALKLHLEDLDSVGITATEEGE